MLGKEVFYFDTESETIKKGVVINAVITANGYFKYAVGNLETKKAQYVEESLIDTEENLKKRFDVMKSITEEMKKIHEENQKITKDIQKEYSAKIKEATEPNFKKLDELRIKLIGTPNNEKLGEIVNADK